MEELFYIQEYYYYVIVFILFLLALSFYSYLGYNWKFPVNLSILIFSILTVNYFGTRELSIGTDTFVYYSTFQFYEDLTIFSIRKDPFYDYLNFIFAKYFDFQALLIFCAFLYVFGAYWGIKKIFKENFYIVFLVFLISPYFVAWGINVMRSGVAASLFLVGLGYYYHKSGKLKVALWFIGSVLFHISMVIPLLFFFVTRYLKNTKLIFGIWISSIFLALLQINIVASIVPFLNGITDRIGNYATIESERNAWSNFVIFGFFPVVFAVYNIIVLKYSSEFYKRLLNTYMLIHIPYIILINTHFALRVGYLSEFMMPILLAFPIFIESKINITYKRLKITLLVGVVFLIKAIKILTI